MRKKLALTVVMVLVMFLMSAASAVAQGPENAGGIHGYVWSPNSENYIGPDYGVGITETWCSDGTWIDVIEEATLMANGHYFSEWWEPFTEKDWVYYKFWLDKDHPVAMTLPGDIAYTATKFIFLKVWMIGGEIELVNYK